MSNRLIDNAPLQNGGGDPTAEFGGAQNIRNNIPNVLNVLRQRNMNPVQAGMQLVNSGQISPEQFQKFKQIANLLTGKHY